MSSYSGLVDAKIRASDKDLPVEHHKHYETFLLDKVLVISNSRALKFLVDQLFFHWVSQFLVSQVFSHWESQFLVGRVFFHWVVTC